MSWRSGAAAGNPASIESSSLSSFEELTVSELKELCLRYGIDVKRSSRKPEIIDALITNKVPVSVLKHMSPMKFVQSTKGAAEPSSAARQLTKKVSPGDQLNWNDFLQIPVLISTMNNQIDATPIHKMTAEKASETRRKMWNRFTPWNNINLLLLGFDLWVLPERPVYVYRRRPIFVINVAPAGSGKSRILQILSEIGIFPGFAPIVVDPDELNEFFVEVFGYHPPNTNFYSDCHLVAAGAAIAAADADPCCVSVGAGQTGWWSKNCDKFSVYERVINPLPDYGGGIEKAKYIRPFAPSCCTAKTYNITTKYGEILRNDTVIDHIFRRAVNPAVNPHDFHRLPDGFHHSDIVFDSTGGAMQDVIYTYIGRAKELGYEIVIAGMFSTPENCSIRAEYRNGKQHRRMTGGLVRRLANEFHSDQTIFKWEKYSRDNKCRFILAENNWLPPRGEGGEAKLVFHRTPDGEVKFIDATSVLFTPTGFYGMIIDKNSNNIFVEQEAAAAAKAAEATTGIGGSRKRRVSRRRLHGSRVRKTVKKYSRPSTRRRRHQRRHSHRRGYS